MNTLSKAGVDYIKFSQNTAASTWNIRHGLGYNPVIEIQVLQNGKLEKTFPLGLTYTDLNTCVVTFSQAYAGYAVII
jgi:hypothetical protein